MFDNTDNNITIRKAAPGDLDAIAKVEALCFPEAEAATKEEFAQRLFYYGNHFWLMFEEDRLIAFVDGMATDQADLTDEMYEKADMHKEDGAWQMIFGVNTVPERRGRGCAGALIKRAIADAREQGRKGLVLTCKEELVHYYAKFGFVDEGISQSVHGNVVWKQMRLTFLAKVIVVGCPGAGKSTFSRRLKEKTGLPLYYLDMLWHKPDRTNVSQEEFDAGLRRILRKDRWIIDGNYTRTMEMRLQECDTVFLLDYPQKLCLAGAQSRVGKKHEDLPWLETELDEEFRQFIEGFSEEVLPGIYALLNRYKEEKNIVVFRSREEADAYLLGL